MEIQYASGDSRWDEVFQPEGNSMIITEQLVYKRNQMDRNDSKKS